jgi:anaerobic ribonucleoside-triphosphate reductase activating protein
MIKYENYDIVFMEIPDKVSLGINITNCQNNCINCHSSQLRKNFGDELTTTIIDKLLKTYDGIDCVILMGEGNDKKSLLDIALYIKTKGLLTALYSGRDYIEEDIYQYFDYIKIGRYDEKYGALNQKTTNQKLLKVNNDVIEDITYMMWNNNIL